jgi:dihydrofolate reductase
MRTRAGAALNRLPKYVITTTRDTVAWANSRVISTNVVDEIARLKRQPGREIQVHGSGHLIGTLMRNNLVDEYRFLIYPVVVGTGRRLFEDPGHAGALQLVDSKTTSTGVAVLTCQPARPPQHGSFASGPEPDRYRILR